MKQKRYSQSRGITVLFIMLVLITLMAVISINFGKMNVSPVRVLMTLLGEGTEKEKLIIYEFRLPRIILAL